ncbi:MULTISPECIES: IS200/IS605 family transposase [Mycobacterium]|uniref:IS200/IS605 family transposase n=1 Tax=Mycobacterium TaxID=1763 RepID=UPI000D86A801
MSGQRFRLAGWCVLAGSAFGGGHELPAPGGGWVACRLDDLLGPEHGWQVVAHEVIPGHVHLFVRVGPTDAPAAVVRAFKGRTARVLRQEFPHLRNFAKVLWSPAFFAASVGYVSETTVRRYIEHQWDAVLAS